MMHAFIHSFIDSGIKQMCISSHNNVVTEVHSRDAPIRPWPIIAA